MGMRSDSESPKLSCFSCIMAVHSENLKLDLSCAKLDSWIRRQAGIFKAESTETE